jgi:hypothetical protein
MALFCVFITVAPWGGTRAEDGRREGRPPRRVGIPLVSDTTGVPLMGSEEVSGLGKAGPDVFR